MIRSRFLSPCRSVREIPAAGSLTNCEKTGYLLKLSGRGFLHPGTWKKRYCVLSGNRFYYYRKEDSKGTEKSAGVINLEHYDFCEEATGKDSKKAANVFIISTADKTLFDLGKYLFSAETLTDMNDWVRKIQRVIARTKGKRRPTSKNSGSLSVSTPTSPNVSTCKTKHDDLAKYVTLEMPSTARLYSATKHRPRGPKGRRLPQRKSMVPRAKLNYIDEINSPGIKDNRMRANSLSALEMDLSIDTGDSECWISHSIDGSQASCDNSQPDGLNYQLSSSDESLVHEELKKMLLPENSINAQYLRSGGGKLSTRNQRLKRAEEEALKLDQIKNEQLPVCGEPETCSQEPQPPPCDPCATVEPYQEPCQEPCREPCQDQEPCPKALDPCADKAKPMLDLSRFNLSDTNNLRTLLQCQCTNMNDLIQTVSTMRNAMGAFQQSTGSLHNNLASVQSGVDGTSARLDKIATQVQQLEQQMIVTLKEINSMYNHAHQLVDEAEKAKKEHTELRRQCEDTLKRMLASNAIFMPSDNEGQSDT